MEYHTLACKSALHQLKRKIPYGWDLNLYRGCEHGCQYCFAIYSHDYLENGDFFNHVYYKENILEQLEKELSSPQWKREVVNIGGVTDSYQPIEAKLKLMPEVWKLMIKYKTPVIISTKSTLILRDLELIRELAEITYVNVASTITCMDESVRTVIEPNAAPSLERFNMLEVFRGTNASIGVHIMPIIPYLTDTYENLNAIYESAARVKAHYVLPGTLYLRGKTKPYFLNCMRTYFPKYYSNILKLYQTGSAGKLYKDGLYQMINEIKKKYHISSSYMTIMREKLKQTAEPVHEQCSFWDDVGSEKKRGEYDARGEN